MVYGCYETRKVHKVELRNRDVFHINMICMLGNESTKRLNITIENKAKWLAFYLMRYVHMSVCNLLERFTTGHSDCNLQWHL